MKSLFTLLLLIGMVARSLAAAPPPLRVHIISGSTEYASEASLKEFSKDLEKLGVVCTASWGQEKGTTLPNLDLLAKADVMLVFARRLALPEEQMKLVRAHWESGKAVVGIRTASHAWGEKGNKDDAVFDRLVLGSNYSGHYGNEDVDVKNVPEQSAHPVLRGVGPFTSNNLYKVTDLPLTTTALQTGNNGIATLVVTMVNEYKGARTFYTTLGIPADFQDRNFRRLLVNAVFWTGRRDVPVKE